MTRYTCPPATNSKVQPGTGTPALGMVLSIVILFYAGLAQGAEQVALQLRWVHQFQFAGYYAALEKGYYAQEGLNVEIRASGPDRPSPLEEVLNGHAQYGVGNSGLVAAYQQGKPVVALAALFQRSPNIWLSLEKSGIHTPQDMVNKKLMMTRSVENAELLVMFSNEGADPDHLNIIPSSFNVMDLVNGKADAFNAYSTNEPYLLKQRGIPYRIIDPHNYGVDFYSDVLFTSQDELHEHPKRVEAFRRASLAGWKYAMAHPEEIADLILDRYSQAKSREHLLFEAAAIRVIMQPDLIEIGHMNPERWNRIEASYARLDMSELRRTLDDFLYQPTKPDWRWLLWVVFGLALTTLVAALIAIMIGRFNRKLKREVADKEWARAALTEANQLFFNVLESVSVALYVVDVDSKFVLFANASAKEQFGEMLEQICHGTLLNQPEPCTHSTLEAHSHSEGNMRPAPPETKNDFDIHLPALNRWYHASIRQVRWLDGNMALVVAAIDTTSRRQHEAELVTSRERLHDIEKRQTLSQERQRLMQDMHDGLGSSLISALRMVERGQLDQGGVAQVLKSCIDDLKLAIDSMEPVEADLLLLLATLRFRLEPRLESTGIKLYWEVKNVPALDWLDPRNALHILRILQEAFTNIIKHTRATEIHVATRVENDYVVVTITDNGQGFSIENGLKSGGKGLSNQLRRAESIGAEINWDSNDAGTRVSLRLPIKIGRQYP